jgi:hypothetical protein
MIVPFTLKDPVIDVFELILSPLGETDAVTDPVAIWDKFKPVTPLADIPYNPLPSPTKEPVKTEAVIDPDMLCIEPYNSINL